MVPGSVSGGRITWTVPIADVGGTGAGSILWDATAFTATQTGPSPPRIPDPQGGTLGGFLGNVIDLSPSFVATPGRSVVVAPPGGGGGASGGGSSNLPRTDVGGPGIVALLVIPLAALLPLGRRRRRTG